MILELVVGGAVLVAAGGGLRWLLQRGAGIRRDGTEPAREGGPRSDGLTVGDVLLVDDDELWLAGALRLEGDVGLALFSTPGSDEDRWLAELRFPAGVDLARLRPRADFPAGRVPDEIRIDGVPLHTRCRSRTTVRAEGEHLPPVTEHADVTVLGGPGGRYLVVLDFIAGSRLALSGARIDPARVDRLPSS